MIPNGRRALSHMSANFYGHPAEKLKIIGITGTNGKTTTSISVRVDPQALRRVHRR